MSPVDPELQNFDVHWCLGDPALIEAKFRQLLPRAVALPDKSIYVQLLTQIALTLALQKRFAEAHETLDQADLEPASKVALAAVRVLLERGRVFHQANRLDEASEYFRQAYELGAATGWDYPTIDAAHMLAILGKTVDDKIQWNQQAIELARRTTDSRARQWLGSLSHNLGQFFYEAGRHEESLRAYEAALACREQEAYPPGIRVAKWAVARSLRCLGREDEALPILLKLVDAYSTVAHADALDLPAAMLPLLRGMVYEELAEVFVVKAKKFARLAHDDLAQDPMFSTSEVKRLERLQQLTRFDTAGHENG